MSDVEKLAGLVLDIVERLSVVENTPRAPWTSIPADTSIDVVDPTTGSPVLSIGEQWDGTVGAVPLDGPVPPVPSAPVVEPGRGVLSVTYDGRMASEGDRFPMDGDHIEIWAAALDDPDDGEPIDPPTEPVPDPGEDPDDPTPPEPVPDLDDLPDVDLTEARPVGAITSAGGTVAVPLPVGSWAITLRTKTLAGRRSEPSAMAIGVVQSVVDPEVVAELETRLADLDVDLTQLREQDLPALRAALDLLEDLNLPELEESVGDARAKLEAAFPDGPFDVAASIAGKNAITYTDVLPDDAPGPTPTAEFGADRQPNDVHRNRSSADGTVYAEWVWTGTEWAPVHYGDGVLRSLDVGKLTAGTGVLDEAVIQRLAVAIATVIELNADRVTAGEIGAGRIDVLELAGAIAEFITVKAGNIVADEAGFGTAVISQLWTDFFATRKLTAVEADLESFAADEGFIGLLRAAIVVADLFQGREFIGGTFTGALFRTAAGGRRWELSSEHANTLQAWSGISGETPGALEVNVLDTPYAGVVPLVGLTSPSVPGMDSASVRLFGETGAEPPEIVLDAETVRVTRDLIVNGAVMQRDLPDPITVNGASSNTVGAFSWAHLSGGVVAAYLTLPFPAWVTISLSGTVVIPNGAEVRVGVDVTGATIVDRSDPSWSRVIWVNNRTGGPLTEAREISKTVKLNAGTNTIRAMGYIVGPTQVNFNYPCLQVVPLRSTT